MGVGLYFCGRNLNKEVNLVTKDMFKVGPNVSESNKDLRLAIPNFIQREHLLNLTEKTKDRTPTSLVNKVDKSIKTIKSKTLLQSPMENSIPTCLYSSSFPSKFDLNGLLFWNISSNTYLYWCYQNKTGSIFILGNAQKIKEFMHLDQEDDEDKPKIIEIKETTLSSKVKMAQKSGEVVVFGEKSLPPYWYMSWREMGSAEKFRPAFQPCLGSFYTYSNKDLMGFFHDQGVVYVCGLRSYTAEKDLVVLDNTPFVKVNSGGLKGKVQSRSKNRILRLGLLECKANRENSRLVIFYSSELNRQAKEEDCGPEKNDGWLLYKDGGSLLNRGTEAGDWQMRIETGKFESIKETGEIKGEPCYSSWWSTYGGVRSKQYVPPV
ncbi:putative integral membrane protein [Cryptosporidium felis]|nr:putative integral membrane protein [Cryptosporidium felis]